MTTTYRTPIVEQPAAGPAPVSRGWIAAIAAGFAGLVVGMLVGAFVIAAPARDDLTTQRDAARAETSARQNDVARTQSDLDAARAQVGNLQSRADKADACVAGATDAEAFIAEYHNLVQDWNEFIGATTAAEPTDEQTNQMLHIMGQFGSMDAEASKVEQSLKTCSAD